MSTTPYYPHTVPLVLYRAMVTRWNREPDRQEALPDVAVFFETTRAVHTHTLESLLHHAWRVDVATLVISSCSERELLEDFAIGPESDGDVRLFEDGYSSTEIFYLDPAHTQFFVRPETQQRLRTAQSIATQRRSTHHARQAFDVARRSMRDWIAGESEVRR